ncbi:GNAT family N-acetyltransferase [Candidatus Woesearchaeota archaeon]|nr:GNAT family N-acetyltransferase [Candidatus Woesearchaeota archaeon]
MGLLDPPFNYWIEEVPSAAFASIGNKLNKSKFENCNSDQEYSASDFFLQRRLEFQNELIYCMEQVPELRQETTMDDFFKRLYINDFPSLCLVVRAAYADYVPEQKSYKTGHIVGFITAYCQEKFHSRDKTDRDLYLWLGGVDGGHRTKGLMGALFSTVEWWANESGYSSVSAKTYPKFQNMIGLLDKRDFRQTHSVQQEDGLALFYQKILDNSNQSSFRNSEPYVKYSFTKNGDFHFNVPWNTLTRERMRRSVNRLY